MQIKILFLLALFFVLACTESGEPLEVEISIPHLTDTLALNNGEYCNVETPLIHENKLILMITDFDTKEGWINCYDKNSLELLWEWREASDEIGPPAKGFGFISYIHDNVLAIAQSNLSYGIDLSSGKTIWKNRSDNSGASAIFGNKDIIATTSSIDPRNHDAIIVSDLAEGSWSTVFNHLKHDSLNVALGAPLLFSWNGVDYLAFRSGKWSSAPAIEISWLNLYNLSKNKLEWTSDTIPLEFPLSGTPGIQPKFEDGQILLANDAIYSYNIEDGSLEWWKWYGNSFVISNTLTAADGMVYGNNDDQYLVGLDVHTGEEIFKTTTGGSSSKIAYHDGDCYLSSLTVGSENRLMVIDGKTGEIKHNVKAPFRDMNRDWTFDRAIAVDPETGLVYTADHRYLLVYDFEE